MGSTLLRGYLGKLNICDQHAHSIHELNILICASDPCSCRYVSVFDHLLLEFIYRPLSCFGADLLVSSTCSFSACQRECLAIKIIILLLLGALLCNAELFVS